jgi:DNA-binding transcriptional regulator YdaS (Cro superfamily)
MHERSPIERASAAAGGAAKLAALLGVSAQAITNWKERGVVPIERCLAIERATGGIVTRRDLRNDWRAIWPELADTGERRRSTDGAAPPNQSPDHAPPSAASAGGAGRVADDEASRGH